MRLIASNPARWYFAGAIAEISLNRTARSFSRPSSILRAISPINFPETLPFACSSIDKLIACTLLSAPAAPRAIP